MFVLMLIAFLSPFGDAPVVTNPVDSGKARMVFTEDLRFGGGDMSDEYFWLDGQLSCEIDVDEDGNIFVVDAKNGRVLQFNPKGEYVKAVSVRGEGPGEMRNVFAFRVLTGGGAVAYDFVGGGSRIVYYDADYNFDKHVNIDMEKVTHLPYLMNFSHDGNWASSIAFKPGPNQTAEALAVDIYDVKNSKTVKTLDTNPWQNLDPSQLGNPSAWENYLAFQMTTVLNRGSSFAAFGYQGQIYEVSEPQYRIVQYSSDFKDVVRVIEKKYEPKSFDDDSKKNLAQFLTDTIYDQAPQLREVVTDAVVARAVEKVEFPRYQNPIQALIAHPDGGFIVAHQRNLGSGTFKGHYFNKKGVHVASFDSPGQGVTDLFGTRMVFRGNYVYTLEKNEDGDNVVVRYRYEIRNES